MKILFEYQNVLIPIYKTKVLLITFVSSHTNPNGYFHSKASFKHTDFKNLMENTIKTYLRGKFRPPPLLIINL